MGKNRAQDKCLKKFKQIDIFGYKVSLTYKNSQTYKTVYGAITTLLVITGISVYSMIQIGDLINFNNYTINTTKIQTKTTDESQIVYLTRDNFDIALNVYHQNATIMSEIDLYFQFNIQQIFLEWASSEEEQKEWGFNYLYKMDNATLSRCDDTRFNGDKEAAAALGITNLYYCPPEDFNFTLYGSYSSSKTSYIQIQIHYCQQEYLNWKFPDQNLACKTKEESDEQMSQVQVQIPVLTWYLDQKDFTDMPVKSTINNELFNTLHPTVSNNQLFKISKNILKRKDSWVTSIVNFDEIQFLNYEYRNSFLSIIDVTQFNPLLTCQFFLNDQYYIIERKVSTAFDVASFIGGFMGIVTVAGQVFSMFIQKFFFYTSLMKELYLVEKHRGSKFFKFTTKQTFKKSTFEESLTRNLDQTSRREDTEDLAENILIYIKQLTPFTMKFQDWLGFTCRKIFRKKKKEELIERQYNMGKKILENQFDIVQLFKQLRRIDLLTSVFLSNSQQVFLPFFKDNVLSVFDMKNEEHKRQQTRRGSINLQETTDDIMMLFIKQLMAKAEQKKKLEKRILKNLLPKQKIKTIEEIHQQVKQKMKPIERGLIKKLAFQMNKKGKGTL